MKIIILLLPTLVGFQLMHTANGDAQYFGGGLPSPVIHNRLGPSPVVPVIHVPVVRYGHSPNCPPSAPRSYHECAGQRSTCWSPGVRDTDCPSHGLCCFNGCVNICDGPPPSPPRTTKRPRPSNPCNPSPCGPGTTCSPSPAGNPICRCKAGLIPNPDTITGCKPECVRDPDCQSGYVCQNQRCVDKPDPCNPSPCGPGATCSPNSIGNPICRCEPGLIPKPDTITGCGPECVRDPDCQSGYVCENQRCVEKADPCDPSPCGPGANCMVNSYGNPICRCQAGLIPKPDTITGCGPECTRDPDCQHGFVCENNFCVEKPDPCDPSPCGPGANCMLNSLGNAICRCQPGLIPKPDTITGCGPECVRDPDCPDQYVCENQKCIEKPDPCDPSPCGPGARCTVNSIGNPICRCEPGLIPNPDTITGCKPECVRDPDCQTGYVCENQKCVEKPDPCDPSPCGPGATCSVNSLGNAICRCNPGLIPKPDTITGCGPECVRDPDCQTGYVCDNQRCVEKPDPCNPSPCGPGTMCMANKFGNPICRCLGKLVPKPDTITGCGPECTRDPDCESGYVCEDQMCVEAPDPCNPNPCGPGAECTPKPNPPGGFTCKCPGGFLGDPNVKCTQGECQTDDECPVDKACENYYCKNPCKTDTCQKEYFCKVIRHIPTCGIQYVPEVPEPRDNFVIGESYSTGQRSPSSRTGGSFVTGGAYTKTSPAGGRGNPFVIGSRAGESGSQCSGSSSCGSGTSSRYSGSSSSGSGTASRYSGSSSSGRATSGKGSPRTSSSIFTIGAAANSGFGRKKRELLRQIQFFFH